MPSYEIARSLGITPRCLGLLTGNFNVSVDGKRVNLGLCVKDAQKGLCVPDFAQPSPNNQGWLYSAALTQILQRYKVEALTCSPAASLALVKLHSAHKKSLVSFFHRHKMPLLLRLALLRIHGSQDTFASPGAGRKRQEGCCRVLENPILKTQVWPCLISSDTIINCHVCKLWLIPSAQKVLHDCRLPFCGYSKQ